MKKKEILRKSKEFSNVKSISNNFSSSCIKFQEKFPAIRPLLQLKQPEISKNSPTDSKNIHKSSSDMNIFLKTLKKPEIFPQTKRPGLKSSLKRPKPLPEKPKRVKFIDQVGRGQKILSHSSVKYFSSLKPSPLSPSKEVKRSPRCTVDELLKNY
jgi:hypothetical protein